MGNETPTEETGRTVMAGRRDASWYSYPNVSHGAVWHIVHYGSPACNGSALISEFTTVPASTVRGRRCRRIACRKRWPA